MANAPLLEGAVNIAEAATEAELIDTAKKLTASIQFHLRKSAEDFWRMGEVLYKLHQQPTSKGRWRQILDEIGINPQSANQAERLYQATTLEELALFKNKTAALRALGILAEPTPKQETPDRTTKEASEPSREAQPGDASQPTITAMSPEPAQEPAPANEDEATPIEKAVNEQAEEQKKPEPVTAAEEPLTPLKVLTQIATRLEYMNGEEIEITPEILAQIDRAAKALDRLRGKEVVHVAA